MNNKPILVILALLVANLASAKDNGDLKAMVAGDCLKKLTETGEVIVEPVGTEYLDPVTEKVAMSDFAELEGLVAVPVGMNVCLNPVVVDGQVVGCKKEFFVKRGDTEGFMSNVSCGRAI